MTDEWGPWVEHDGKGCPVPLGTFVRGQDRTGLVEDWVVGRWGDHSEPWPEDDNLWIWMQGAQRSSREVVRYQVRRPRALSLLRDIAAGVRDPAKEDA